MKDDLVTEGYLDSRLSSLEALILLNRPQPTQPWLKSFEVRKLLKISSGKLQKLRVKGELPYSRIGGLILYKYEDVKKLVDNSVEKR